MKTFLILAAAATLLTLGIAGESVARPVPSDGYQLNYDAQTLWTVWGEVISLDEVADGRYPYKDVHLLLKTAKGDLSVHLGPSWFVDRQIMRVAPLDVIEVTGSPVIYRGKVALIAEEIRKGSDRLQLRTAEGAPVWNRSPAPLAAVSKAY